MTSLHIILSLRRGHSWLYWIHMFWEETVVKLHRPWNIDNQKCFLSIKSAYKNDFWKQWRLEGMMLKIQLCHQNNDIIYIKIEIVTLNCSNISKCSLYSWSNKCRLVENKRLLSKTFKNPKMCEEYIKSSLIMTTGSTLPGSKWFPGAEGQCLLGSTTLISLWCCTHNTEGLASCKNRISTQNISIKGPMQYCEKNLSRYIVMWL